MTIVAQTSLPLPFTMSCKSLHSTMRNAYRSSALTIPDFLLPSFARPLSHRQLSTTQRCRSRIGSAPLSLPEEVNIRFLEPVVDKNIRAQRNAVAIRMMEIEGPRGKLTLGIPPYMSVNEDHEARKITLEVADREERKQREMWGTTRAYLNNYILGVSEGHTAILRLVGVGYRATIESAAITKSPEYPGQQFVSLKVGYSHPIELGVPLMMKASVPQPTRILLEGPDKEVVNQFAALIRKWRVPEPYKGKGIFVNNETIKLKATKVK